MCVGGEAAYTERCGSQCWACLNDALYCATHPSYTSNEGPTAIIYSRYVDEVPVGLWVVLPETDGRPSVEVVNGLLDPVSLKSICSRNGSLSVVDRMFCTTKDIESATLYFGKLEAWSESSRTHNSRCRASLQLYTGPNFEPAFLFRSNVTSA